MRLFLVRHGETPWNAEGRFQGQNDQVLTQQGLEQAHLLGRALHHLCPVALYSSPLPRAMMTAQEIASHLSLSVEVLDGLKEVQLGELEGITAPQMREQYPLIYQTWQRDPSMVTFPGGESLRHLQSRAWRALRRIERAHPHNTVVAVSHNFAIRTIVSRFLGLPLARFHRIPLQLGSITALEMNGSSRQLLSFNQRCHLFHQPAP